MTTDHDTATGGIARISAVALATGAVLVVTGSVVSGSAAAYGALVGTAIAVGVFGLGSFVVGTVARLMPAASLLVALLTYTMQLLVLVVVFVVIRDSGLLDGTLDRRWLGGAILLGAGAWMTMQLWVSTTLRIPTFDTASDSGEHTRSTAAQGGAR